MTLTLRAHASKIPEGLFSSLTHDLSNLKQWLGSKRLSRKVLKTKCLFTGTRHKISQFPSQPHICLDGNSIERVNILANAKAFRWMKQSCGKLISLKSSVKLLKYLLPCRG